MQLENVEFDLLYEKYFNDANSIVMEQQMLEKIDQGMIHVGFMNFVKNNIEKLKLHVHKNFETVKELYYNLIGSGFDNSIQVFEVIKFRMNNQISDDNYKFLLDSEFPSDYRYLKIKRELTNA
ncbi:hypothetical protein KPC_3706 [Acinetobacter stercoris]|uniref:Uncharacterized protein n=2 Tax=Acinetobacter stercoris TaxID=2126983 RepID=A0A2U3N4C4_9GAMM|nr:hypothetical protein KPC_3706 [Acinetobacter stercoris]